MYGDVHTSCVKLANCIGEASSGRRQEEKEEYVKVSPVFHYNKASSGGWACPSFLQLGAECLLCATLSREEGNRSVPNRPQLMSQQMEGSYRLLNADHLTPTGNYICSRGPLEPLEISFLFLFIHHCEL